MIDFEKMHGTGNDFIVIDANEPVADRRRLAIDLCDRESGLEHGGSVGADGILFLALEAGHASPRVVMTLVQPDGSTAPMCGNGARCAAKWAVRRLHRDESERSEALRASVRTGSSATRERATAASAAERTGPNVVMVDTQVGTRRATVDGNDVSIEMGPARFAPDAVALARDEPLIEERVGDRRVTAVDTGVPHAVAFVDDVSDIDLGSLAPPIRHAGIFERGANVTLASPREDGPANIGEGDVDERGASVSRFDQRTYERGVEGETRSCGTGAVAVAAVARKLGLVGDESVCVHPPGGLLTVRFSSRGAILAGPTEREFAGRLSVGRPRSVEIDGEHRLAADD